MAKKDSKKKKKEKSIKSFRRAYREDYVVKNNLPGAGEQVAKSFGIIIKNWKLFLPLLIMGAVFDVVFAGTQLFVKETGGVFTVITILILWLISLYFARHIINKQKVSFWDGLFNALGPLISTLIVFAVVVIECIPIFLLIIVYSAAMSTEFLTGPFYILLFLGFAALMILISGYFLPVSLITFVAVSAPGLYPVRAFNAATELMKGRKMNLVYRLVALVLVLMLVWAIVLFPLAALKLPQMVLIVFVTILMCFSIIYIAVYLYIYYIWVLNEEK